MDLNTTFQPLPLKKNKTNKPINKIPKIYLTYFQQKRIKYQKMTKT